MPKKIDDRERFHLLMPAKTKKLLDDLQRRTKATNMTEVIRNALAVYDAVSRELEQGKELIIRDPKEKDPKKAEKHVMIIH